MIWTQIKQIIQIMTAPTLTSLAIFCGIIHVISLVSAQMDINVINSVIPAAYEYNWGALIAQIHADPALLELCSKELSSFNKQAAEILLKHSDIKTIQDAELAVNFFINEGEPRITWGLKGMDGGIHLSRLPPSGLETSGDVLPSLLKEDNGINKA